DGQLAADFAGAGAAHEVSAETETDPLMRVRGDTCLPHTVDSLIPPGGVEGSDAAHEGYRCGREEAVVGEPGEGGQLVIPGPVEGDAIGADPVAEACVDQAPVADDKAILNGEFFEGLIARHPSGTDVGVGSDARVGGSVG